MRNDNPHEEYDKWHQDRMFYDKDVWISNSQSKVLPFRATNLIKLISFQENFSSRFDISEHFFIS